MSHQGDKNMPHIERFAKTPKAWEALARPDLIGRQAHTLLLMANGRRSERELSLLLGKDIAELAHGLQRQGYLQAAAIVVPADEELA
jgi:hypothetical protein